ncbi:hypothetical protein SCUCBS95973_003116 [Sporothrix curviconia]|uniref:Methyltransferase domain-containing protein n=1 Tax=Sporothrix curviconia TaxID=1260050 RepID=A0ABP0BCK5_9PEZI
MPMNLDRNEQRLNQKRQFNATVFSNWTSLLIIFVLPILAYIISRVDINTFLTKTTYAPAGIMNIDIPNQPKDGRTWKEVNKEHYDNLAEDTFKIKWIRDMHLQIIDYLLSHRAWIGIPASAKFDDGTGIRILDYACGNGVLSLELAPYAAQLRGVDISSTMVKRYNEAAEAAGLAPERMRAVEADLAAGADPFLATAAAGPEYQGFDMALISMALHHVEHPVDVLKGIASRLAPGGKLLVIDMNQPEGAEAANGPHDHSHAHAHDQSHAHAHDHAHDHDHSHDHAHSHSHEQAQGQEQEQAPVRGPGDPSVGTHTVVHHGFTEKGILQHFADAGLVNGEVQLNPTESKLPPGMANGRLHLFYAVAEKPRA